MRKSLLVGFIAVAFLVMLSGLAPVYGASADVPRNIIYIIGDGSSFVQLEVGRIMKEGPLTMDSTEVRSSTRNA